MTNISETDNINNIDHNQLLDLGNVAERNIIKDTKNSRKEKLLIQSYYVMYIFSLIL